MANHSWQNSGGKTEVANQRCQISAQTLKTGLVIQRGRLYETLARSNDLLEIDHHCEDLQRDLYVQKA